MKDAKGHGSDPRGGGISVINGQGKVARIAQMHGIQGGPIKVQTLDTKRAGPPWATQRSYRNNTVAEHVAKFLRMDNGSTTRIRFR